MKKLLLTVGLIAVLPLFALPSQAQASTDLDSSMLATCVGSGGGCDMVRFSLSVDGASTAFGIRITSSDGNVWAFDDVTSIEDGSGNELLGDEWTATISGSEVVLDTGGADSAVLPVYITVAMVAGSTGTSTDFTTMSYTAEGNLDGSSDTYSTGGTVTPEPLSMILMGTGLAGIAGAARRRREDEV